MCKPMLLMGLALLMSVSVVGNAAEAKAYKIEFQVVQVNASITNTGLNSQTLPGEVGMLQIMHERWYRPHENRADGGDDCNCCTEVIMEGDVLTWNGKAAPEANNINVLARPTVMTNEGKSAKITIAEESPTQYMLRREDGFFELKQIEKTQDVGLKLELCPRKSTDRVGVIDADFSFHYSIIEKREAIEGVELNIGIPTINATTLSGEICVRVNEWTAIRYILKGQGTLYIFMRCTEQESDK